MNRGIARDMYRDQNLVFRSSTRIHWHSCLMIRPSVNEQELPKTVLPIANVMARRKTLARWSSPCTGGFWIPFFKLRDKYLGKELKSSCTDSRRRSSILTITASPNSWRSNVAKRLEWMPMMNGAVHCVVQVIDEGKIGRKMLCLGKENDRFHLWARKDSYQCIG